MSIRLFNPLTWPIFTFLLTALIGSLLLLLPCSTSPGAILSPLDACFLAVSATCVTGLSPVDISSVLTPFGQGVLLICIQTGGLGTITFTSLIFLLWRNRVPFTSREAVSQNLLSGSFDLSAFLWQVAKLVFGIEAVTALLLWLHNPAFFHPFSAVFHAVSAFCNAGFALAPDNLMSLRKDGVTLFILGTAIVLGGLGFGVLRDLSGLWHGGSLSRYSRLVIKTSLALILGGGLLFFLIEFWRPGNEDSIGDGFELLCTAFFHSVSARTAGFNSVSMPALSDAGLMLLMALMFIGGGSGSCAGGIKVSCFRILAGYMGAQLRGERQIVLEGRGVPARNLEKALTLFFLYCMTIAVSTFCLSITENGILHRTGQETVPMLPLLFESVSALGTVGLSMDITPLLSAEGKAIVIADMLAGRVGLLSIVMALHSIAPQKLYAHAETDWPLG